MMEETLMKHRSFLVDRIDPDFGLLDKLFESRTLTREAVHKIKLKYNTTEDKNRMLIDFVLSNMKAAELLTALNDTSQRHLVNYLNADGVYDQEYRSDWPLDDSKMRTLESNHSSLVDLIDTGELYHCLFAKGIISRRQRDFILSKSTDAEKNEAFLDILSKCSQQSYKMTIGCLLISKQGHIADILAKDGVVFQVHATLNGEIADVDETEDEIVSKMTRLLDDRSLDEIDRLLELVRLRAIAARKGHSVVIYFHFSIVDHLVYLLDLLHSGQLRKIIETIFNRLFLNLEDTIRVTLDWSQDEVKRCSEYFGPLYDKKRSVAKVSKEASGVKLIRITPNKPHKSAPSPSNSLPASPETAMQDIQKKTSDKRICVKRFSFLECQLQTDIYIKVTSICQMQLQSGINLKTSLQNWLPECLSTKTENEDLEHLRAKSALFESTRLMNVSLTEKLERVMNQLESQKNLVRRLEIHQEEIQRDLSVKDLQCHDLEEQVHSTAIELNTLNEKVKIAENEKDISQKALLDTKHWLAFNKDLVEKIKCKVQDCLVKGFHFESTFQEIADLLGLNVGEKMQTEFYQSKRHATKRKSHFDVERKDILHSYWPEEKKKILMSSIEKDVEIFDPFEMSLSEFGIESKPLSETKELKGDVVRGPQTANMIFEKRKLTVTNNYQFLMENMKPIPLIDHLHLNLCITEIERDVVNSKPNDFYRNDEILHWMKSFTNDQERSWDIVLNCLRQTFQTFIADMLTEGKVAVKSKISSELIYSKFELNLLPKVTADLREKEASLVGQLNNSHALPMFPMHASFLSLGHGIDIAPFCRCEKDGIVAWFLCNSKTALKELQNMYEQGFLLNRMRRTFKELSQDNLHVFVVPKTMTIFADDFEKLTESSVMKYPLLSIPAQPLKSATSPWTSMVLPTSSLWTESDEHTEFFLSDTSCFSFSFEPAAHGHKEIKEDRFGKKSIQVVNNLTRLEEIVSMMRQTRKLTRKECESIRKFISKPIRANEEFLKIIAAKSAYVYESFVKLLKDTHQAHLYQLLVSTNDWESEQLDAEQRDAICRNFVWLTETLDNTPKFVDLLLQSDVLTAQQERILSKTKSDSKNVLLLSILKEKSPQDFTKFVDILEQTDQHDIVSRLKKVEGSSSAEEKGTSTVYIQIAKKLMSVMATEPITKGTPTSPSHDVSPQSHQSTDTKQIKKYSRKMTRPRLYFAAELQNEISKKVKSIRKRRRKRLN